MKKRFSIFSAILLAAAVGFADCAVFTGSATAFVTPPKAPPRVAKKTLKLDDPANLREIEPTRIAGYVGGFVEENGVYVCDAGDASDKGFGVATRFELNQTEAKPVVAVGASKAEGVSGNVGGDYSLYLDVELADGTMLWGQQAAFPVGDSDWTEERVRILPPKPIKSLTFYGLFRNRSGKASFKDLTLFEANIPDGFALFDGVPVETASVDAEKAAETFVYSAQIRDVAKSGDFLNVNLGKMGRDGDEIDGILVQGGPIPSGMARESAVCLTNCSGEDRALTFVVAARLDAEHRGYSVWGKGSEEIDAVKRGDLYWLDDPRRVRKIEGGGEYLNANTVAEIGLGRLSRYPIGGVATASGKAFGWAVDPDYPAFYRIGYSAATRELYLAFDVALTKEKPTAEFRFTTLSPDNSTFGESAASERDAFRRLWARYVEKYPEAFVVRAPEQGNWMPFADISDVPGHEDFGFKFKEGNSEVGWDDEHGIVTFRYTEPTTWWLALPKDAPKTLEAAVAVVEKLAAEGNREAQALLTCGIRDANGNLCGQFLDTPWCDGIVWSVNDAPGLVNLAKEGKLANGRKDANGAFYPGGFETNWNAKLADELYPPAPSKLPKTRDEFLAAEATVGLDGEYVDSSEGYVTAILDFERSHFAGMTTPLVFDAKTKRPAIYRGLIAFEYVRKIAGDVRARGKLAMANSTPGQFFWLVPQLDVLGTETNWNWQGRWSPSDDATSLYRRTLCGGKPYCYLMNTDFDLFSREMVEKYMKRSLAYGMFPGFFSADASTKHYFDNPGLYERDRELFKKYLPLCKAVAEAGWNPVTGARSNDDAIYVESFGELVEIGPEKPLYFTVFNDSQEEKAFEIALEPQIAKFAAQNAPTELTSGETVASQDGKIVGKIGPEDVRVFRLK